MKVTATFYLKDEEPRASEPKWVRILELLAIQHGGQVTVTRKCGQAVPR